MSIVKGDVLSNHMSAEMKIQWFAACLLGRDIEQGNGVHMCLLEHEEGRVACARMFLHYHRNEQHHF